MHKVLLCWAKVETWNHFSSAEGYIHIQNYRLLEVEEDAAMNDVQCHRITMDLFVLYPVQTCTRLFLSGNHDRPDDTFIFILIIALFLHKQHDTWWSSWSLVLTYNSKQNILVFTKTISFKLKLCRGHNWTHVYHILAIWNCFQFSVHPLVIDPYYTISNLFNAFPHKMYLCKLSCF